MHSFYKHNNLPLFVACVYSILAGCHSFDDKPKDYIEIDATLQPIIIDSINVPIRYSFKKDKAVACGWPENQQVINNLQLGYRFVKPLSIDSLESKGNNPENKYIGTSLINDSTISTVYHLVCWPRHIWRPGQPPPPPPPYQAVEIKFVTKTRHRGYINTKVESYHQKTSITGPFFILVYNNLPSSPSQSIERWIWSAKVSVHNSDGVTTLPLSDEIPRLGNWSSEIVNNKLVVQYKP